MKQESFENRMRRYGVAIWLILGIYFCLSMVTVHAQAKVNSQNLLLPEHGYGSCPSLFLPE